MKADLVNKRIIAFVFARGGSKGLPGKNIKPLLGKPLIAHAIEVAKEINQIETVIVSTDDDSISKIAREFGAEVPFLRPTKMSTDGASEWIAWQHAIKWFETHRGSFDIFVSLPTTAPLRHVSDVRGCINCLLEHAEADIVVTGTKAARSPYFNMVRVDEHGLVELAVSEGNFANRQETPQLFDLTTVAYVARTAFIKSASRMFDGRVRLVEVPPERAIDIDTSLDFEIAEFLGARNSKIGDDLANENITNV